MSIERIEVAPRMSQAVVHGNTIYLAGQVGTPGERASSQMKEALANVERLLGDAGACKSSILNATIWLNAIDDYAEMNVVWDDWITGHPAPARATAEVKLPEGYKVEVIIVAAVNGG